MQICLLAVVLFFHVEGNECPVETDVAPSLKDGPVATIASNIPDYHLMMVNDHARNDAFYGALRKTVKGRTVLDVGAGSGLLSMMAIESGATSVVAVENMEVMQKVAHQVLPLNGFTFNSTHFTKGEASIQLLAMDSTQITLPNPPDVLVSEILDSHFLGEGWLPSLFDLRKRNQISPETIVIPYSADIYLEPAQCAFGFPSSSTISGFNLEPLRKYRSVNHRNADVIDATPTSVPLCEKKVAISMNFQTNDIPTSSTTDFVALKTGVVNSLHLTWITSLDKEKEFNVTNDRRTYGSWSQGLMMLNDDVYIKKGETLRVNLVHSSTSWMFTHRVIGREGHTRRLIIAFENRCSLKNEVEFWWIPPPGSFSKKSMVANAGKGKVVLGTSYPGHLFGALVGGEEIGRFEMTLSDEEQRFVVSDC